MRFNRALLTKFSIFNQEQSTMKLIAKTILPVLLIAYVQVRAQDQPPGTDLHWAALQGNCEQAVINVVGKFI